ncbi:sugar carrier protein C-like [Salvia divinorum]|uniref:Sugar carrier protein C-like n=1 Tax=Salvia divinorum TaxID=28513 RepID=A0ABD1I5D0_SALDI
MGDEKEYPGNLTPYVIITCVIAATGGLTFGYDIGISGGVTSMEAFLKNYFPSVMKKLMEDSSVNAYCRFDSHLLSMFTSSLYLAALSSSFVASTLTRKLGRKTTMVGGGVLFFVGALINALARPHALWMLIFGRTLQGFGVGFSIQSVPLYLSEMAPYKYRGALNIGFQLCITLGILAANLLNYAFSKINGDFGWRLSLGGAAVPATVVTLGALALPETPTFMIERGKHDEARAKLRRLRGVADVDQEFNDIVKACEASKKVENPMEEPFQEKV